MTPAEWNKALAPSVPATLASDTVANEARGLFATIDGRALFLSTTELADTLYAPEHARGEDGTVARKRLFSILRWLAAHTMAEYATPGEPVIRVRFGKKRAERPLVWHAPMNGTTATAAVRKCPHCGRVLQEG